MSVTEQSKKKNFWKGISGSEEVMVLDTEQSKEGPSNEWVLGSATGKRGIKNRLIRKQIEQKYKTIIEVEKGHNNT